MTVDDWVFEAVEKAGSHGATVRDIQRFIDDHHYEELAVDTIEAALEKLAAEGRVEPAPENRWSPVRRTTKDEAMKRLFGSGPEPEETP